MNMVRAICNPVDVLRNRKNQGKFDNKRQEKRCINSGNSDFSSYLQESIEKINKEIEDT